MCKETHAASPSTQPSPTLMLHEYRQPRNIAKHAQVFPLKSRCFHSHHITCGLARHFVNIIAVATAGG